MGSTDTPFDRQFKLEAVDSKVLTCIPPIEVRKYDHSHLEKIERVPLTWWDAFKVQHARVCGRIFAKPTFRNIVVVSQITETRVVKTTVVMPNMRVPSDMKVLYVDPRFGLRESGFLGETKRFELGDAN